MQGVKRKIDSLIKRNESAPTQRSKEWFFVRNTAINASEIAACLTNTKEVWEDYVKQFGIEPKKYDNKSCSHFSTREDFIIDKCKAFMGEQVFFDSIYTLWGKTYEEIATRMYRQVYKTPILEFGSLPHSRDKWLRASPDGITPTGVMLEIKCPYKRKINGVVPFHYYLQVMTQLYVCNLDKCDFLECEIIELNSEKELIECEFEHKGILINKTDEEKNSETKYVYPPDSLVDVQDYINWYNNYTTDTPIKPIYYAIKKWNVVSVNGNKEWFNTIKPILKEHHVLIRELQDNPEQYCKYRQSIDAIKHKKFNDMYETTTCLLDTDVEDLYSDDDFMDYTDDTNETEQSIKCLISE